MGDKKETIRLLKLRKYALLMQYAGYVEQIEDLRNKLEEIKGAIKYITQMIKETD